MGKSTATIHIANCPNALYIGPRLHSAHFSPFGIPGAVARIVIAVVTLLYQLFDPVYRQGVFWVAIWFAIAILYFALLGRHSLVLSPEERFATEDRLKTGRQQQEV
jgi:ethanolamine permease